MSDLDAAALSLRSLLNCVLREYPERVALNRSSVRIVLSPSGNGHGTPRVPFEHRSPTGHRLFGAPLHLVQGVDALIEPQAAAELLLERLGGADGLTISVAVCAHAALSSRGLWRSRRTTFPVSPTCG